MSTAPTGPAPDQLPPASAPTPGEATPRRALVLLMIMATAGLFVGLFAVLYFRWSGAQEPSSALVVVTTPAFDGAEIVVDGIALPKPYRVRLGARTGKSVPFYLDRGSYTLRITYDGRDIYTSDFIIEANRMMKVELAHFEHLLPTTAPAAGTTPADDGAVQASTHD
jgi:hypothetical protein